MGLCVTRLVFLFTLKRRTERNELVHVSYYIMHLIFLACDIVQELCESRGGRPGLSVLTSLLASVDVKNY